MSSARAFMKWRRDVLLDSSSIFHFWRNVTFFKSHASLLADNRDVSYDVVKSWFRCESIKGLRGAGYPWDKKRKKFEAASKSAKTAKLFYFKFSQYSYGIYAKWLYFNHAYVSTSEDLVLVLQTQ